ncbi:MAG TPA: tetratricopeptide repeat protein [Gemmatimonadaceae bacterium]|nr:tetratricopeptide repeat protein [Gemmatimonadaceae bacterium]
MPTPFLSSEEYDERAHQLYNEGQYDEALTVLREGLALYPNSVELHVGVGYARLAREEFAWARRAFEEALVLEPEHEDGLAGLGETLLKFGLEDAALRCFHRILELGYTDDIDLVLQVGRSLFREASLRDRQPLFSEALHFFEAAVEQTGDSAEAVACMGYAKHRLGDDEGSIASLRKALQLDGDHSEARIYLANLLYDRGEFEGALYHFERTQPEDHWDELGIWRLIELKRAVYKLDENDAELRPWDERLAELSEGLDDIDELLMELEPSKSGLQKGDDPEMARNQLELFGSLLTGLVEQKEEESHHIVSSNGTAYRGSWDEIVTGMRDTDAEVVGYTIEEYMQRTARRVLTATGIALPSHDAESFVRASARAGLLRIVR